MVLYHHSSAHNRESISRNGLLTRFAQGHEAIFLSTSPVTECESDIWEVTVDDLLVEEDCTTQLLEGDQMTWHAVYDNIGPQMIRLIQIGMTR